MGIAIVIVVLTIIVFILVDLSLRIIFKKMQESKIRKEREAALAIGLKLDYTDEAVSLKRVQIDKPKARILAVDDEAIVLDSFRKILVPVGYSVDTVESGQEAIGLVRKNEYDFVFTDLKMPVMDGLDVTKAVKHLRPDFDVIMITGFATIESAVAAMKYGAMDYIQKPFTEDELVDFVNKSLIRRMDRLDRQIKPVAHLVTPSVGESTNKHEFNVPSGIFISPTHTWVRVELNGLIRIGLDDFAQKAIGQIDSIELPAIGQKIEKNEPLFTIRRGEKTMEIPSPINGEIVSKNVELLDRPGLIKIKPFELGWMCSIEPSKLGSDLQALKIGADAVSWYKKEIDTFVETVRKIVSEKQTSDDSTEENGVKEAAKFENASWEAFSKSFLS